MRLSISFAKLLLKNRTLLLSLQAACAGFAVAMLYALSNTSFILANGAKNLPYAYLWACVITPPLSFFYNRLQRRWPVSKLNVVTVLVFTLLQLIAWAFSQTSQLNIAAYVLFIGYTLALTFLIIVVTTQANRLFNGEEMKTKFPIILALHTLALIACGLVLAPLSRWLDGEMQTLLVGAGVMLVMLLILTLTTRSFPQLSQLPKQAELRPMKMEKLLKNKLAQFILLYQFLSSTGSLLIIYLLPLMAERVYHSSDDLTEFFGRLIALTTLGALLFLIFASGKILVNKGVGFGLIMNPVGVIVVVALMLICSIWLPGYAQLLLALAAMARALDFILAIGATETSVNTFIKQLPDNAQLPLINAINAQAVPLSYGATAILILALQLIGGSSLPMFLLVTMAMCIVWTIVAFRLAAVANNIDIKSNVVKQ